MRPGGAEVAQKRTPWERMEMIAGGVFMEARNNWKARCRDKKKGMRLEHWNKWFGVSQ